MPLSSIDSGVSRTRSSEVVISNRSLLVIYSESLTTADLISKYRVFYKASIHLNFKGIV